MMISRSVSPRASSKRPPPFHQPGGNMPKVSLICRESGRAKRVPGGPTALA